MDDIFISYARDDRELVERLAQKLEEFGYRCWFDRELTIGKEFREQIVRRVENARCVVAAWSAHSAASPWVQDEAERALKAGKLVSVIIAPCRLPTAFESVPTLDLSGAVKSDVTFGQPESWAELQRAVAAVAGSRSGAGRSALPRTERGAKASRAHRPTTETHSEVPTAQLRPKVEGKTSMSNRSESPGGSTATLVAAAVALVAGAAIGGGGAFLLKPSGSALPYSVAALPEEVRSAVAQARDQQAEAQKNAVEAVKKARAALYHANAARKGADPTYEARAVNPSAPSAFDYYYGQKIQQGSKSLGMTNVTVNDSGVLDPHGDHHIDYLGEHDGTMFGGFGVRVVDNTEYLQGRFRDGVPDGAGVLIQSDRSRYEGYFDKDRQDGFAVEVGPAGQIVYEGQWKSGERDGPGVEWREAGCVYVAGVWSIGKIANPKEGRLCKPAA